MVFMHWSCAVASCATLLFFSSSAPEVSDCMTVVTLGSAPDCKCTSEIVRTLANGNNACVSVVVVPMPQTGGGPLCFIPDECGPAKECHADFRLDTTIVNWAGCCGGNMITCLNCSPSQLIPHLFGGTVSDLVTGTKIACLSNADTTETDANMTQFVVVCGNSCAAGGKWGATYHEKCIHCPAGDDG